MSVRNLPTYSSPHLQPLSLALGAFANSYDLGPERDILVYAFDPTEVPNWQKLPAIWHTYGGSSIVINMGKFYATMYAAFPGEQFLGDTVEKYERTTGPTLTWRKVRNQRVIMPSKRLANELADYVLSNLDCDRESAIEYTTYRKRRGGTTFNTSAVNRKHRGLDRLESTWYYSTPHYSSKPMLYNLLIGALMRECGYAVFTSQIVDEPWFSQITPYQRNIIAVFEELRVERQQMIRLNGDDNGGARRFFRSAVPVTANTRAIIADMTSQKNVRGKTGMTVANIALNSSLILGRVPVNTLLEYEVQPVRDNVEEYLDSSVLDQMVDVWTRYIDIAEATRDNVMPLVEEWQGLFPSQRDGQNASSSVAPDPNGDPQPGGEDGSGDPNGETGDGEGDGSGDDGSGDDETKPNEVTGDASFKNQPAGQADGSDDASSDPQNNGELGGVTDTVGNSRPADEDLRPDEHDPGKAAEEDAIELPQEPAARQLEQSAEKVEPLHYPNYEEHQFGPNDLTPSHISYDKAVHRKPMNTEEAIERGREIKPSSVDHANANALSRALENLNVTDRGKFKRPQVLPPGRLRSRAAVQQAAERSLRLAPTARPWERTVRTVDLNPPLTIGVMTDVSASQGWAQNISAQLAWIFSHAVSKIGGRVAALTFGMGVTITQRPGELMRNAQVVRASDGGELFDMGAGTMDTMLNLVNGSGTRLLFVLTDGRFGVDNELAKAALWVDTLVKAGVYVVWVTPDPSAEKPEDERDSFDDRYPMTPRGVIPISAVRLQRATGHGYWYGDDGDDGQLDLATETRKIIDRIGQQITIAVASNRGRARL